MFHSVWLLLFVPFLMAPMASEFEDGEKERLQGSRLISSAVSTAVEPTPVARASDELP